MIYGMQLQNKIITDLREQLSGQLSITLVFIDFSYTN